MTDVEEYKAFLWGKIDEIQRRAREEARPFLDELERLIMMEPPPPIFISLDQLPPDMQNYLRKIGENPLTGGSDGNIVPTPPEIDPGPNKDRDT